MPQRITAFALVVPDYDAGIDFYVHKLGFDLIADEDQGHKLWVVIAPSGGGVQIVLGRAENADQLAAIGNQSGGRVSFFLETDDFEHDHAAMLAAGVDFEEEPRLEPYGTVVIWRDPFGNRWDLIEPKSSE